MLTIRLAIAMIVVLMGSEGSFSAVASAVTATTTTGKRPPSSVKVPLQEGTGHIVVPVQIQGQGPFWFIVDTGNQQTTLFARLARQLGIESRPLGDMQGAGTGSISVRVATDVAVALGGEAGPVRFVEPQAVVLPDEVAFPPMGGRRIDGLLGGTLFEGRVLTLDQQAGYLQLDPAEGYEPPRGAQVMQLRLSMGFPYLEGQVVPLKHGKVQPAIRGNYLLDLGAAHGVSIEHGVAQAAGLIGSNDPALREVGQAVGIDGEPFSIVSAPAAAIRMGGLALDADRFAMLSVQGGGPPIENLVGTVGIDAFAGRPISLDYGGGRLILAPQQ